MNARNRMVSMVHSRVDLFEDVVHMYHCLCLQVEHSSVRSDRTIGAENPFGAFRPLLAPPDEPS